MRLGARIWFACTKGWPTQRWLLPTLICAALAKSVSSQPANDRFANRTLLAGFPVEIIGSNIGATAESSEPREVTNTAGGSVWWEWTTIATRTVTISTAGSAIDTILAIYTGTALTNLTLVASNDDEDVLAGIFTSRVNFFAQSGTHYSIVVAGVNGADGKFDAGQIRLSVSAPPVRPGPVWTATGIDGRLIRSSDFAGKVVLLDFWATWCVPCRAEIPIFIDLQNRFRKDGLVIVGVSVDTVGPSAVSKFMTELGMNYPVIFAQPALDQALGGIPSIPTAFLIDRDNNILLRHVGFGDQEFWANEIAPLLGKSFEPPIVGITAAQTNVTVSWPGDASGFLLERTRQLFPAAWVPVTPPVHLGESRSWITLPITGGSEFFRLRMP